MLDKGICEVLSVERGAESMEEGGGPLRVAGAYLLPRRIVCRTPLAQRFPSFPAPVVC